MAESIAQRRIAQDEVQDEQDAQEGEIIPSRNSAPKEQEKPKPKTSLIIGGLLMVIFIALDIIDIAVTAAGSPDDVFITDIVSYIFLVPYILYYKFIKKADFSGHMLLMSLVELIPVVGKLPLRSIGLAITLWIDRHPEGKLAKGVHVANKVISIKRQLSAKDGAIPARSSKAGGNVKQNRSVRVFKESEAKAKLAHDKFTKGELDAKGLMNITLARKDRERKLPKPNQEQSQEIKPELPPQKEKATKPTIPRNPL